MKKFKNIFLLSVLILLFGGQLFGVSWRLEKHKLQGSNLAAQVNVWKARGFTPLGISLKDDALYVFYYENKALRFESWKIRVYKSILKMKDALSDQIEEGYIPSGLSMKGNKIVVLYIKVKNSVNGWRLVRSAEDTLASFKVSVQPWLTKKYIPSGISFYKGRYYTLLLKIPSTRYTRWRILRGDAKADILKKDVDKMVLKENWVPGAFSYRESETYTVYLR